MDNNIEIDLNDDLTKDVAGSLSDLFWTLFEEGVEDLDKIVDQLVKDLLNEGSLAFKKEAFQKVKEIFPENVKQTIMGNPDYQKFLEKGTLQQRRNKNEHMNGSDSGESGLDAALQKLGKEQKPELDANFTLIYEEKDKDKDSKVLTSMKDHKNKDFLSLFNTLRAMLFDLLKRREGLLNFVLLLKRVSAKEKPIFQKLIRKIQVKEILILLLESLSKRSMGKLGPWLATQYYPLPICYPISKKTFKVNLDCCSELMFQTNKPLITSIGTKSSVEKGKSSLLSYLFSTKKPDDFSSQSGFSHSGSIDLYVKVPQEHFKFIIADVNGYSEDKEFQNITSIVMLFSQLVLVHITQKDIEHCEFIRIIPAQTKFVVLFRDYNPEDHSDLSEKLQTSLTNDKNFVGFIKIQNLSDSENSDATNTKNLKQQVFEDLSKILNKEVKDVPYLPIAEIKKSYDLNRSDGSLTIGIDLDKESKSIRETLETTLKESEGKGLHKVLFPCFWLENLIEKTLKNKQIEKSYGDITEEYVAELGEKYLKAEEEMRAHKESRSRVVATEFNKKIACILSSNDSVRILMLLETINNWKMKFFGPIKEKYIYLCTKISDIEKELEDRKNFLEKEQIKAMENEKKTLNDKLEKILVDMDDKDISLESFLDEINSLYEAGKIHDTPTSNGIKGYILSNLQQGAPINIINGKNLKFGSKLLKDLFEGFDKDNKNVFIISIIGAQSSAKSTLLNVLFGCGFATSAERCTKGLYISLIKHPSGRHIIVIDTEGLLSVVVRDSEFDNLITTMSFACSHVVIINNKGEITSKLRNFLEICVYAMKNLKLARTKPKVIFALRDMVDTDIQTQREQLIKMIWDLEKVAKEFDINVNDFINITEQDVFLLPSAFKFNLGENGIKMQSNNELFSQKVLELRTYILDYLSGLPSTSELNLKEFYLQTEQLWSNLNEHGKPIMRAKNLIEIPKHTAF